MSTSSRAVHRPVSLWALSAAFWATVALVLLARAAGAGDVAGLGTGALIFSSILVEALPFVLVGAVASAVLHVYAKRAHSTMMWRCDLAILRIDRQVFGEYGSE